MALLKNVYGLIVLLLFTCPCIAKPLQIVTTIKPIHSLVSSLVYPIHKPVLLLKGNVSPHYYHLKPSDIRLIDEADIFIWIGPSLESFLINSLHSVSPDKLIQLDKTPKLKILSPRNFEDWENLDEDQHEHNHEHHHAIDPHFWLDPINAKLIVDYLAKEFKLADPDNAYVYTKNAENLKAKLDDLNKEIKNNLIPFRQSKFIVFHDAYQYFEKRYHLQTLGSIVLHPEIPPSAKHLKTLQEKIKKSHTTCVFTEPQFQPKIIDSLIKDLPLNKGMLDPIGAHTHEGEKAYFELMRELTNDFKACFKLQ
ncbi:MAG: hypothetical protein JWM09_414 [Francisellaceae bacterium]|nr:hypothetical protein [Francisellaceae bacterium]